MKVKVIFFGVFFLTILHFFLPFVGLKNYQNLISNEEETSYIQSKEDNPNNLEFVSYPDGMNYIGLGNVLNVEVIEDEDRGQQIVIPGASSYDYGLMVGSDLDDVYENIQYNYFTLYDVTDNNKIIETKEILIEDNIWYGTNSDGDHWLISCNLENDFEIAFDAQGLNDFHDYRIGINLQMGDDLKIYSPRIHLSRPEVTKFSTSSTETSIAIDYKLTNPTSTVTFDYNELYIEIDNRRFDLNTDKLIISDSVTISDLDVATEYEIVLGYDLTKIVSSDIQYDISHEFNFVASTLTPSDYIGGDVVAVASILLFILLIILLILIIVILYWNYQRRKVSGMALVVGEDTEAYDPVYQYNYHQQEDETGVPNVTSSNQGDEVYGYFDDVQDNQEELYGYFDEVQDNEYHQDEVYGYFDEVYDDAESGIHDYENPHEDFDDMEEW